MPPGHIVSPAYLWHGQEMKVKTIILFLMNFGLPQGRSDRAYMYIHMYSKLHRISQGELPMMMSFPQHSSPINHAAIAKIPQFMLQLAESHDNSRIPARFASLQPSNVEWSQLPQISQSQPEIRIHWRTSVHSLLSCSTGFWDYWIVRVGIHRYQRSRWLAKLMANIWKDCNSLCSAIKWSEGQ